MEFFCGDTFLEHCYLLSMIQLQKKAYVLVTDMKIWNSLNVYFFTFPRIKTTQKHKPEFAKHCTIR